MENFAYIIVILFGLIVGSYLNVVILRYGKESSSKGRSKCIHCSKILCWYELIPVVSYFIQTGKCRKCKKRLSIQYPLVEIGTAGLFLFNYMKIEQILGTNFGILGIIYLILTTISISLLVFIFVFDSYHKIIPDAFSYTFAILGVISALIVYKTSNSIYSFNLGQLDLFAPIFFFVPLYLIWRISGGRLIGLGDGKLSLGIGAFLGLAHGLSAIFLSFWIGAVFAVFLMLIDRLKQGRSNITMKSEIAFGPFMIIGFLLVYFLEIDVTGLSLILNVY